MRDSPAEQKPSALSWLVASIVAAFLIELVFQTWFRNSAELVRNVALTIPGLRDGRVWTLLSYGFLHWNSAHNLLHVAAVVAGVLVFGRELLPSLGARRFIGLYAGALVLGGLTWAAANWSRPGVELFGGMPGVFGLLTVFACFHPHRDFSFTFFFVPVTLKPKHLALGLASVEFAAFLFYELYGAAMPFGYAPSAHLGGMAAGLIYYRFVHAARWPSTSFESEIDPSDFGKKKHSKTPMLEPVRIGPATRDELRAEVDRILDKINSSGLSALTPGEKRVLDEAKDQLTRR